MTQGRAREQARVWGIDFTRELCVHCAGGEVPSDRVGRYNVSGTRCADPNTVRRALFPLKRKCARTEIVFCLFGYVLSTTKVVVLRTHLKRVFVVPVRDPDVPERMVAARRPTDWTHRTPLCVGVRRCPLTSWLTSPPSLALTTPVFPVRVRCSSCVRSALAYRLHETRRSSVPPRHRAGSQ